MDPEQGQPTRIAIIGGGAAGTITACELARLDSDVDVDVIERSGDVGPGLAYSTPDPLHVVNVWAGRLSADPDDPDDLVRWLDAHGEEALPQSFPERRLYGRYLRERFAERTAAATRASFRVLAAAVTGLDREPNGIRLTLTAADGSVEHRHYDSVVLALGNVEAPPSVVLPFDARCFASPWQAGALDPGALPADGSVLVIGTGLTAVDAALALSARAPGLCVTMTSRNGHLPHTHLSGALRTPAPIDSFPTDLRTMDELAAAWRTHVERALAAGHDWRDAVDGLRPITQRLWRSLEPIEQGRFLHEHRRWWEARRNRAAPRVGEQLEALVAAGRLEVVAGGVRDLHVEADGVHAVVGDAERRFDRVVCCTGPTSDIRSTTNRVLTQLLADGIVTPDVHQLGIRTRDDGAIIDADGVVDETIYTLGWLRRGELWETLAIPEIRVQAKAIAAALTARVPARPGA
jgi:uncharacterized NAD(P)/FAD-binding protein YdhS